VYERKLVREGVLQYSRSFIVLKNQYGVIVHTTECSKKKGWWTCDKGHSWLATVHSRRNGNGCPYCSGFYAVPGETDLLTLAPHLAKEWEYERNTVDPSTLTLKSNVKVWWVCERGHNWKTQVWNSAKGCGCPYCAGKVIYSSKNVKV
jgi:hypothetical protein